FVPTSPAFVCPAAPKGWVRNGTVTPNSARHRTNTIAILSLLMNVAFIIPSIRAATLAGMAELAATPPATVVAALIVEFTNLGGRAAESAPSQRRDATNAAEGARPWEASRARSLSRACSNRLFRVLGVQPRRAAASSLVRPSR